MKKLFVFLFSLIAISVTNAQGCLSEGITFSSQQEIDNFQINYPNCMEIEGSVTILGANISNLNGLIQVKFIQGDLWIGNGAEGNPVLTNLSGLDSLSAIGGQLSVFHNDLLNSLEGLEGLKSVNSMVIMDNKNLTDLIGLNHLATIGTFFTILSNQGLTSLDGMQELTTIGGALGIGNNINLTSLEGLQHLVSIGGDLTIDDNYVLQTCHIVSICNYLMSPNGQISISGNATGCNSEEEIKSLCASSVDEMYNIDHPIIVRPNPFATSATIKYELAKPSTVQLTIYDYLGKQVELIEKKQTRGNQQIVWNTEGMQSGVYFCIIKTNCGVQTIKLNKL